MANVEYHAPSMGFYEAKNVVLPFGRGTKTVHLLDHVLPAGTQEQHAQRRIKASNDFSSEESFYSPSLPDFIAILDALKGNPQARDFSKGLIRSAYLTLLSRARYNPAIQDEAIHDFGLPTQYSRASNIVGPDGNVLEMPDKAYLFDLTGMEAEKLAELFSTINKTSTYNWRLSSKPITIEDRVARLVAGSNRASLDFSGGPSNVNPSPGVRIF